MSLTTFDNVDILEQIKGSTVFINAEIVGWEMMFPAASFMIEPDETTKVSLSSW